MAGRRNTDADALDVMKMTVAGKVNVDVCASLLAAGLSPIGLHGASSLAVRAVRRPPRVVTGGGPEPIDFGFVGDVTGVNLALFELLVDAGYVPVVACLGADAEGACYNINADVVGGQVAVAVGAKALLLVSDVPGVLRDLDDPGSRISRLTVADGRRAIADGTVKKGMIPKLEESFAAIARVPRFRVIGRLEPGQLPQSTKTLEPCCSRSSQSTCFCAAGRACLHAANTLRSPSRSRPRPRSLEGRRDARRRPVLPRP